MNDSNRREYHLGGILLTGAVSLLFAASGFAIEAPKPATPAPAEAPVEPPRAEVTATDETAFYQRLEFVTHKRNFVGLTVADEVLQSLSQGAVDKAVTALSAQAAAGDTQANIALVRLQHWCNRVASARPADTQTQIDKLATLMPAARLPRVAGVLNAEKPFLERARKSCGMARFEYGLIEERLRAAADKGDPASATELAQFTRDARKRQALLQQAVDKNFAPAQQALATARLIAVQRGETTENVSSIRMLFKQAGLTLPRAKVDLANCMALGCDGHPADAPAAAAFGMDAARDGEPSAFLSMVRMPWGGRIPRVQILAWQYYGDRLNEAGCAGDAYIATAATFAQTIGVLEKGQNEQFIEQAKARSEDLWRSNSTRAMTEQGCGN